jgi:hypothetical protein
MWTGRVCSSAVQVVLVGVVRSSLGDYAWYGSDVLVVTYADRLIWCKGGDAVRDISE